ncbi:peroxisome proliferator-activated receptor gamma coactivator 1-alpha-like isoform X2 [Amblyraja radiata]|uniref:peroxisome proliferator-activated receptor gamma coactivator 1-alpha-like isoform X2 n=1 Tax=Amblyraja radiata TaxID=386614 RepID=UPI001403F065|nr:peroxisome proliferator-activated receptor gamma coactivator 1-alpha-like isoform X2 [Amblyraja radiata]
MPAQQPGTTNPSLLTGEPLSAHRAALHSRRADLQYRHHPSTMVGAAVRPHCQLGEDRSNRVTQRGKMADCSLTDEDFSSFVFNYLTENAESQYGSVAGEDRLYSDFPEIDLSQLDVTDLDSVSCLSELQWDNDQMEISSSQYSTDDSELFETIEDENEALLAALTETLDDIQVDDVSLSAFKELAEGVVTDLLETASLPTPDGSPPTTKADEPSLLRKLLLAPQNAQLNYERQKESNAVRHASSNQRSKSHRSSFKVDGPQGTKPHGICQHQHRPHTELHKHLTSTLRPPLFKTDDSKIPKKDQSNPVWTSQHHQSHHQQAKPTSLLLSPESESDCKESPIDNKPFEQALSVELCGTAGLTPPTTPPHKATRDDPFKTAIKIDSSVNNTINQLPIKNHWSSLSKSLVNKHPEQTELYAYLSKATVAPIQMEGKKVKRSYTRCFGDHDYCQLYKSETETEKNVLRLYELPNSSSHQNGKEKYDDDLLCSDKKQKMSPIPNTGPNGKKVEINKKLSDQSSNKKPMRDQEIRDKLFKHFGYPEEAITDEVKQSSLEDNDCVPNECCYHSDVELQTGMKKPGTSSPVQSSSISLHKNAQSLPKDPLQAHEHQLDVERTRPCSNQQHKIITGSTYAQSRSPVKREFARNTKHDKCLNGRQIWNEEDFKNANPRDRRIKAMDDCRIIYIGKLAYNITPAELKRRFEVFGEIEECKLLTHDRGVKYGFIAYRYSEDAASALKNGHKLQKRSEPALHLYYGGLRQFCKANYTDLDSSAEDLDPAPMKSKYDTMDFDSLLKEAQKSLTR